jgi:hypothetical protein
MAGPQFVIRTCDRIAEGLQLVGQKVADIGKNSPTGFWRQIGLIRRPAPEVITRVDRLHVRCDLAANTRTKSIASNQQISALAAVIGETNVNTAADLLDTPSAS